MTEAPILILACVTGAGLGAIFFGGLWWTLRKAMTSAQPALWFVSSLLLRVVLTLSGLFLVSAGHWQRMLACLLGFTIARSAVTWLTRPGPRPAKEVGHAAQS